MNEDVRGEAVEEDAGALAAAAPASPQPAGGGLSEYLSSIADASRHDEQLEF